MVRLKADAERIVNLGLNDVVEQVRRTNERIWVSSVNNSFKNQSMSSVNELPQALKYIYS